MSQIIFSIYFLFCDKKNPSKQTRPTPRIWKWQSDGSETQSLVRNRLDSVSSWVQGQRSFPWTLTIKQPSCGCWRSYWEPCKSNYSGCSQKGSYLCTHTQLLVFKVFYCLFPLNFTCVEHSRLVHIETRFVWFRTEWRGVWRKGSYGALAGRKGLNDLAPH